MNGSAHRPRPGRTAPHSAWCPPRARPRVRSPRWTRSASRPGRSSTRPGPRTPTGPTAPTGSISPPGARITASTLCPATPSTLALYLTAHAETLKASTMQRRLVAIAQAHRAAQHPTPTEDAGVRSVWRGIRRRVGTAQVGKAALLTEDIKAMVAAVPETHGRRPGPRAHPARLRRGLPPLRAGGARRGRRRADP